MGLFGGIGKFLFGGSKKTGNVSQQGSVDTGPWGPSQAHLTAAMDNVAALYRNQPLFSADETAGYDLLRQTVGAGNAALDPAIAENNKTLSGAYLDPNTNPYLKDIATRIGDQVFSSSTGSFSGAGRTGSGLAGYYAGKGAGDAVGEVYNNNYQAERGRMAGAVGMAPGLEQGRYLGPQALISAGQQQSARPWDVANTYSGIMANIGGLGQKGWTTGEMSQYANKQGLVGKIADSFSNKLFNLG